MRTLNAYQAVHDAVDADQTLSSREKRRIKGAMRWRPRKRREILGLVMSECYAASVVDENGTIQGAMDWQAIIEIVRELLPIILEIISLFGG